MFLQFILSFVLGGFFCVIAQLLIDLTSLSPARILVFYVCAGVLLGAIGIYKPLIEIFGCGATVPLTGFGANIAKGVKESIDELGFMGILKGPLSAAAAGCSAALVFGFICSLIFKGSPKRA